MLDKLINPQLLHNKPYLAIPTGFFFVLLAFVSTAIVFPAEYSVIVIAFASLLILPYVLKAFELDELNVELPELFVSGELNKEDLGEWARKCLRDGYSIQQVKKSLIENNLDKDLLLLYELGLLDETTREYVKKSNFFSRHSKTTWFYTYLFVGMFLAFFTLYVFSGGSFRETAFKHQLDLVYGPLGHFNFPTKILYSIVLNNLKVMILCAMLSLFYGAGAILILTYNASIAGVLYGDFFGTAVTGKSLTLVSAFLPHTTLEILAYLFAAIGGGILSKAFVEAEPGSGRLLLSDGLKFLALALILVLIAGVVEVILPDLILSQSGF